MSIIKKLVASFVGLNPAGPRSAMKLLSVLLAFILGATLWVGPTAAAEKKYVTDPTTGKVVSAPEYGGTITYAMQVEPANPDTGLKHFNAAASSGVVEKLGILDWAIDRDVFDLRTSWKPEFALRGHLAESWDISPDGLTYTFHIRDGVRWHNKAPMNGRKLTAKDVEYNFHRMLGLGSGFTEKPEGAAWSFIDDIGIESVTAEGSTVVFRLSKVNFDALRTMLTDHSVYVYPPEVIEAHGDVTDWRNLVGTGPLMLTDWVEGSSITWSKNPDYWGYDEKYPQNRLPYVDKVVALVITDSATQLAALRSGQVDLLGSFGDSQIRTIDQAERLQQTNPEIVLWPYSHRSETSFALNQTKPPMNDIRVRHALQLALDLETINATVWQGWVDITPQGFVGANLVGYVTPFEEWPEEVKQYYTYDPERAERLLDEAGYPRGADGIRFSTNLMVTDWMDLNFFELAAQHFGEIGVEVTVLTPGTAQVDSLIRENEYEHIASYVSAFDYGPLALLQFVSTNAFNPTGVQDPEMDRLWAATQEATTLDEYKRWVREADQYVAANHWILWGGRVPHFMAHQSWVKGYNGELSMGGMDRTAMFSRLWIDSELKEAMGY